MQPMPLTVVDVSVMKTGEVMTVPYGPDHAMKIVEGAMVETL